MTRRINISSGIQAIVGGVVTVAGAIIEHKPEIVPLIPDKYAHVGGLIIGAAGLIVSIFSHPPVTPLSGHSISKATARNMGIPLH